MKTASLKSLNPEEKAAILDRLLSRHPELVEEAAKTAEETLSGVSAEEIAARLLSELTDLGFDELHGRAGNKSFGYVGPEEAAWEIFQETVQPYLDDLKRRLELSPKNGALAVCQGIILGLYRFENDQSTDLLEYAQEFPAMQPGWQLEC